MNKVTIACIVLVGNLKLAKVSPERAIKEFFSFSIYLWRARGSVEGGVKARKAAFLEASFVVAFPGDSLCLSIDPIDNRHQPIIQAETANGESKSLITLVSLFIFTRH